VCAPLKMRIAMPTCSHKLDVCKQASLGLEVTGAIAGTLEVAISFSGPSLTIGLSDVHVHVKAVESFAAPSTQGPGTEPAIVDKGEYNSWSPCGDIRHLPGAGPCDIKASTACVTLQTS
jgi:hypothetical protein